MKNMQLQKAFPALLVLFLFSCQDTGPDTAPVQIMNVGSQGYITSGDWSGYAWISSSPGVSVTPSDFNALPAGGELAVTGNLPADSSSSTSIMLGINLDQNISESTTNRVTLSGDGISYRIRNTNNTDLRLGLYDELHAKYYWINLSSTSGNLPYSGFNTTPWVQGSGEYFNKETVEINSIIFLGYSTPVLGIDFDFSLLDLYEYTN